MNKFLTTTLAFLMILTVALIDYQPAKAQTCTTNCYYATVLYVENANGTPFTGTLDIYFSYGTQWRYGETYTNGVSNSGYVWSGQYPGTWYGIGFTAMQGWSWKGSKTLQSRYSSPPLIPDVTVMRLF